MRTENLAGEPVDLLGWGARDMSEGAKQRNIAKQMSDMVAETARQRANLENANRVNAQRNAMIKMANDAAAAAAKGRAQAAAMENARAAMVDSANQDTGPAQTYIPSATDPNAVDPNAVDPNASPEMLGFDFQKNLPLIAIAAGAGFLFFTKAGKKLLRKIK